MNSNRILAGVADLFFSAKISAVARHVGTEVEFAGSEQVLLSKASPAPSLIILDLNQTSLNPVALIGKLKADPELAAVPIVGYANHENTDLMAGAKEAGCEEVLTRGAFSNGLPQLLGRFG